MKSKTTTKKKPVPSKRAPTKRAPGKVARAGKPAKGEGDTPVFAYYARLPPEQQAIASKLDAIATKNVRGLKRALKWNVPFYGVEGKGWFCAFAAFKNHTSVNFFEGVKLEPAPRDGGVKENRRVVYETLADVDVAELTSWVRQAAALPGWLAPPSRGGA